jgi:hypothetical protein
MPGAVLRVTRTVPVNEELVCSIVHSATTGAWQAGGMRARRKRTSLSAGAAETELAFNAQAFLESAGVVKTIAHYGHGDASSRKGMPAGQIQETRLHRVRR